MTHDVEIHFLLHMDLFIKVTFYFDQMIEINLQTTLAYDDHKEMVQNSHTSCYQDNIMILFYTTLTYSWGDIMTMLLEATVSNIETN